MYKWTGIVVPWCKYFHVIRKQMSVQWICKLSKLKQKRIRRRNRTISDIREMCMDQRLCWWHCLCRTQFTNERTHTYTDHRQTATGHRSISRVLIYIHTNKMNFDRIGTEHRRECVLSVVANTNVIFYGVFQRFVQRNEHFNLFSIHFALVLNFRFKFSSSYYFNLEFAIFLKKWKSKSEFANRKEMPPTMDVVLKTLRSILNTTKNGFSETQLRDIYW